MIIIMNYTPQINQALLDRQAVSIISLANERVRMNIIANKLGRCAGDKFRFT